MSETESNIATRNVIEIARAPEDAIAEATKASNVLRQVIEQNKKQLLTKIGSGEHLRFEAWQTLGWFYGITAEIEWTSEIYENDKKMGYAARAAALRAGQKISAAEAECRYSESNWKGKDDYQLRSMAQTRACAKALRNVLAWVVVLAGYSPTPAEEMVASSTTQEKQDSSKASAKQIKYIWSLAQESGWDEADIKAHIKETYNASSSKELTKEQANEIIEHLNNLKKEDYADDIDFDPETGEVLA